MKQKSTINISNYGTDPLHLMYLQITTVLTTAILLSFSIENVILVDATTNTVHTQPDRTQILTKLTSQNRNEMAHTMTIGEPSDQLVTEPTTPAASSLLTGSELDISDSGNGDSDIWTGDGDMSASGTLLAQPANSGTTPQESTDTFNVAKDVPQVQVLTTDDNPMTDNGHSNGIRPQQQSAWLNSSVIADICSLPLGFARESRLSSIQLSGCSRYDVKSLLSPLVLDEIVHTQHCERLLRELVQLDHVIGRFNEQFEQLLTRYNCHNGYSVKWTCHDCKKAYKDWLCAVNLPHFIDGVRVKPCISFCERVEQRCPYLHPITREQYGGQPVFICIDPNIPFVSSITPTIAYSDVPKCYELCHIRHNASELLNDSLAKYLPPNYSSASAMAAFGASAASKSSSGKLKCPQKDALAQEVLAEQQALAATNNANRLHNTNKNGPAGDTDDEYTEEQQQQRLELAIVQQQQQQQQQLYEQQQRLKMLQQHLQQHQQQKHHDHR